MDIIALPLPPPHPPPLANSRRVEAIRIVVVRFAKIRGPSSRIVPGVGLRDDAYILPPRTLCFESGLGMTTGQKLLPLRSVVDNRFLFLGFPLQLEHQYAERNRLLTIGWPTFVESPVSPRKNKTSTVRTRLVSFATFSSCTRLANKECNTPTRVM